MYSSATSVRRLAPGIRELALAIAALEGSDSLAMTEQIKRSGTERDSRSVPLSVKLERYCPPPEAAAKSLDDSSTVMKKPLVPLNSNAFWPSR